MILDVSESPRWGLCLQMIFVSLWAICVSGAGRLPSLATRLLVVSAMEYVSFQYSRFLPVCMVVCRRISVGVFRIRKTICFGCFGNGMLRLINNSLVENYGDI